MTDKFKNTVYSELVPFPRTPEVKNIVVGVDAVDREIMYGGRTITFDDAMSFIKVMDTLHDVVGPRDLAKFIKDRKGIIK